MENDAADRRQTPTTPGSTTDRDTPDQDSAGHDDPRLEEVGDQGSMPGELVDTADNMPGDQPEDDRPPSPTTPGYRTGADGDD